MQLSMQDNGCWGLRLRLPSWDGYQSRLAPYGSIDRIRPSDGTVDLIFAPEGRGSDPLNFAEAQLVSWFEQNEPAVSQGVKSALLPWCCRMGVPNVETEQDLSGSIGLYAVNIHPISAEGLPYVGFEFGCEWDEAHGLGVLMHGVRPVEIGSADVAILLWIAEQDAERRH